MTNTDKVKQFEKNFYSVVKENNLELLEFFLLNSDFPKYSQSYKQSVMDYLVYNGHKFPNFDLPLWSLTNDYMGVNGNIHENADRPLRLAASLNVPYAKFLLTSNKLKEHANINETNDGSSAILNAIQSENLDFVKFLLTSKELKIHAKLNISDKPFNDPLCKACEGKNNDILEYLLSEEAYVNQDGFSPVENLQRFQNETFKKLIRQDNKDMIQKILQSDILDIKENGYDFLCQAITIDARKTTDYLSDFLNIPVDLMNMRYKDKSIFFHIAHTAHNSRIPKHSFLHEILENPNFSISYEEIDDIDSLYHYGEIQTEKLMAYIERFEKIHNMDKVLQSKEQLHKKLKL